MLDETKARLEVESLAVDTLSRMAARQLALPKNRSKGCPTEPIETLVRMAQAELDEVLHAVRSGRGEAAVLAELGDAAAFVGLAMWRAKGGGDG